jgi:allantoate deiminase
MTKLQAAVLKAQPVIAELVGSSGGSQACSSSSKCSNLSVTQSQVPVLLSGAGHDAMAIADITSKIAMVFVRCKGGVSHNPAEFVDPRDVAAGTAAFATFMEMDLLDWEQHDDRNVKASQPTKADDAKGAQHVVDEL